MASLPTTQTECSNSSSELIQLLVNCSQDADECSINTHNGSMANLIAMLNTPTYVEGIMNMRGKLIPIISLRK